VQVLGHQSLQQEGGVHVAHGHWDRSLVSVSGLNSEVGSSVRQFEIQDSHCVHCRATPVQVSGGCLSGKRVGWEWSWVWIPRLVLI
jgi:hypothetical protein